MSEPPKTRWAELTGGAGGEDYAGRFAALAASGADVHGEASYAASLVPPPARVLDAGCGTGRVAARLAELGYACTGVDVDPSMLAVARREHPGLAWVLAVLVLPGGCGELGKDYTGTRPMPPTPLTPAEIGHYAPGTPERTLLAWCDAVQHNRSSAARRMRS